MPYKNIIELPEQVRRLPDKAQLLWLDVFNLSVKHERSVSESVGIAFSAVRKLNEVLINKSELVEEQLFISKANLDKDGNMGFVSTSSDTKLDTYKERMSLDLFRGFVKDFSGEEFISLSHYPKLSSGKGSLGVIKEIYIDGDRLKMRGQFYNTPLGISAFNSLRKDRRDEVPNDKRVRVSIGFYDKRHIHGNNIVWEAKSRIPCPSCALGIKDKTYLYGALEHLALTRVPANRRAEIDEIIES